MLKRNFRQVYCYDLEVKTRAKHASPPPLLEILNALGAMVAASDCHHERDNGSMVYRLGQISIDPANNTASILVRRCDVNAANAVYSHKTTGALRVATRNNDEGGDRAAHLVVSLLQERGKPNKYLCHMEGIPGLSHRLVQVTLNAVLKRAIDSKTAVFRYPDPAGAKTKDGNPKLHEHKPYIELFGHPSPELVHDLEQGTIRDIRLIADVVKQPLGASQYLEQTGRESKIKVKSSIPSQGRLNHILDTLRGSATDYSKARVSFTDPLGTDRTIEFDINTGNPEQDRYVKSYPVTGINPPMDDSSEILVPFLTSAMLANLLRHRST